MQSMRVSLDRAKPCKAGEAIIAAWWVALAIATPALAAEKPQSEALGKIEVLPARADIRFAGTSTLHDFNGRVASQPFVLTLASNQWSARAEVVAGEMTTASKGRDKKMWEMLGAAVHPRIIAEVAPSPMPSAEGAEVAAKLRIRDQVRQVPVRISNWVETASELRFHAEWDMSLKEYGLKPPSVVGLVRVGDRVHLEADVIAQKGQKPETETAGR